MTAFRIKYYFCQDVLSFQWQQHLDFMGYFNIGYIYQNKFKFQNLLNQDFKELQKINAHMIRIFVPTLFNLVTHAQSCISIKPYQKKMKWENFGYIPLRIQSIQDILDPFKLITSFFTTRKNILMQKSTFDQKTCLGIYSKHNAHFNL